MHILCLYVLEVQRCPSPNPTYAHTLEPLGSVDTADDANGGAAALAPKIITAELDFKAMEAIRVKMPIQQHRRADVFRVELVEP